MGGEKKTATTAPHGSTGSPPRRRGKDGNINLNDLFNRITPAWAGKSSGADPTDWTTTDHPRVGGEKYLPCFNADGFVGSPPRGRGKAFSVLRRQFRFRITPAWAGKSMTAPGRSSRTGDHPRVGGEKNNHIIDNQYGKGSPPRRRGKGGKSFTGNMFTGITPAWAGKS